MIEAVGDRVPAIGSADIVTDTDARGRDFEVVLSIYELKFQEVCSERCGGRSLGIDRRRDLQLQSFIEEGRPRFLDLCPNELA